MKIKNILCIIMFLCFFLPLLHIRAQQGGKLKMWYNKSANIWNYAIPVGNGRLGAMVYDDPGTLKYDLPTNAGET